MFSFDLSDIGIGLEKELHWLDSLLHAGPQNHHQVILFIQKLKIDSLIYQIMEALKNHG